MSDLTGPAQPPWHPPQMRCTLEQIAKNMDVDARTVRRYLEKGLVPEAYRTAGGHWRLPGTAEHAADRLAWCSGRQDRAIRNAERRGKKAERTISHQRPAHVAQAVLAALTVDRETEAVCAEWFDGEYANDFYASIRDWDTGERLDEKFVSTVQKEPDFWLLVVAAYVSVKTTGRPTGSGIADVMRKSRSWLYGRYGGKLIRRAIERVRGTPPRI